MIYVLANPKGGVGKSTTSVHLATKLAAIAPTLLIDGDTQPSAASWAAWREELAERGPDPVVHQLTGPEIMTLGADLSKEFENTVIDVGGRDSVALRAAVLLADMLIIPLSASSFDSAALTDMQDIIAEAQNYRSPLPVVVLLTRLNSSSNETRKMLSYLHDQGLKVLDATIMERVAFRRATEAGSTVQEQGKDKKAIEEVNQFFKEVTA